jgi:hypothetical protein
MPQQKRLGLFIFLSLISLSSCDPCQTLAHGLCECLDTASERAACRANINLAKELRGFKIATDPQRCLEALKPGQCLCEDFKALRYEKCALYR